MNAEGLKRHFSWDGRLIAVSCAGCGVTSFTLPRRPETTHASYCKSCGEVTLTRISSNGGFLSAPIGRSDKPFPVMTDPKCSENTGLPTEERVPWESLVFEVNCLSCAGSMFAVPYETGKTSGISCSSCGAVSCLKVLPDGSLAMLPVPPKSSSGKLLAEVLRLPGVTGISLWGLAQGRGLDREMTNSLGMRMRLIGPGCFQMGSEGGADAEKIVHPVTISRPFYLGVVPVTQGQFERLMGGNPSRFKGENRPVEMVSWVHADEFCRFLADKEGYSYRLPTEAEWEYACRAGTPTDYYWGEEIDPDFCWYKQTSNDQTRNVGQLRPNGWGLYDMSGNVWEWCMDRYGEYSYEAQVDPTGAKAGENRVIRGGAWNQFPPQCRSSYRNGSAPGKGAPFIGFRVVMIPPLPDITGTALRRPPGGNG